MKWEGFLYSYCLAVIKTSPGFEIVREEKYGGNVKFMSYQDLEDAFAKQEVYPLDLKNAIAIELNKVF